MPGARGVVSRQQSGPSPAATTSDAGPWGFAFIVSVVFTPPSIPMGASGGQTTGATRPEDGPTALALNILVASIVTISFHLAGHVRWRALVPFLAAAAGGLIGAELGARRLGTPALRRALALVLAVAGLKLIFLG